MKPLLAIVSLLLAVAPPTMPRHGTATNGGTAGWAAAAGWAASSRATATRAAATRAAVTRAAVTPAAVAPAAVAGVAASDPPGSYRDTCVAITFGADDVLRASCEKLDGSYQSTDLANVGGCLASIFGGGDIGNIDGNLVCIPDLPDTEAGIRFPEAETTVNGWIYGDNDSAIFAHGWGIWAGLTHVIGTVDGTPARAFETWATPSNMIFRTERAGVQASPGSRAQRRLELARPRQFSNRAAAPVEAAAGDGDTGIFVSVAYNPPAAQHAISNRLFLQSTLNAYLRNGYTEIPAFPPNAITIKPVFKVIPANVPDGIYTFPGWPGTPSPARTFGEAAWNACVYVDIHGSGTGGSAIDEGCTGRTTASTFFLHNFIHHQISAADANYLTQQLGVQVSAGDFVILVGMHVTTREIERWTWQTFWWAANPAAPGLPSSDAIAAARPLGALDAAAAHYAMSVAYSMVSPAQPVDGGANVGEAVIGYNPHLEAGFDPRVFQIVRVINQGTSHEIDNRYGVQTNCMTCHGFSMYDPTPGHYRTPSNRQKPYATDFYVARNDAAFAGKLQLDFAWSLLGSLVLDDDG